MLRYGETKIAKKNFMLQKTLNTFNLKDEDKNKNDKLMSFRIDDKKLLEKYKTIWTKAEDLKN